jgi:hypothetical protein
MEQASRFIDEQNAVIPRLARSFYVFARARQWKSRPKCLRQLQIYKERRDLPSRKRGPSFSGLN